MNLRGARLLGWAWTRGVLLVAAVLTIIPFLWMTAASFKSNDEFFRSVLLPWEPAKTVVRDGETVREGGHVAWNRLTTDTYSRLFGELDFGRGLVNSIFLSSVTGILATVCCAMGGYALSKFHFKGRTFCTVLVLAALLIPGPLLIAPTYQLLYRMNLLDTFSGLILPALAPAFGVFLFRQAINSGVPNEVLEAARIDGASEWRTFVVIVLPLVRPMIGTFLMITFLSTWNNFISPQVVLQEPGKFPLSVAVAELRRGYYNDYGLQMAGTIVSILPVMVLFLVMQKDFVSGLTSGAVKA
ncbi:MAG: carbohydrate ABC transporter permease [Phycisphaerales bacterium]|nr:carbohydrate ABC transporter permease [Planctomycetota bacterium]